MDYLSREAAPFGDALWEQIDTTIVETLKKYLVGRRFLPLYGPLGPGAQSVAVDSSDKDESFEDGVVQTTGRKFVELVQLYEDFPLFWRDLEASERTGVPVDLSAAARAAQASAKAEDQLIFFGNKALGVDGLLTVPGSNTIKMDDWAEGQNAFANIAAGASMLVEKDMLGRLALVMGPDLYFKLQRIQPGTGVMEIDRIKSLLDGRVYRSNALAGKAVLVCAEAQYMDLTIGQDLAAAYLEMVNLNHYFRILETAALRVKNSEAIVVFE